MARRYDQRDKRGREEHFNEGHIGLLGGENSGEWIGVVDAEALGGTDSDTAVVLVESNEVDVGDSHVYRKSSARRWYSGQISWIMLVSSSGRRGRCSGQMETGCARALAAMRNYCQRRLPRG